MNFLKKLLTEDQILRIRTSFIKDCNQESIDLLDGMLNKVDLSEDTAQILFIKEFLRLPKSILLTRSILSIDAYLLQENVLIDTPQKLTLLQKYQRQYAEWIK